MPDHFTPEEFARLMEPWDERTRAIAQERMQTGYTRGQLVNFSEGEAATLRAVLRRLIPEDEGIDLAGFVDWAVDKPLGRGDRRPGMPADTELLKLGLAGLDQAAQARGADSFRALSADEQDAVLRSCANDTAVGAVWQQIPSGHFFERLYSKALHGYLAHPNVWMRIGFMGASYPEGYTWLTKGEVKQRHERQIGWERL